MQRINHWKDMCVLLIMAFVFLAMTGLAHSQSAFDLVSHLQCFKIKDEFKIKGSVSTFTPQFGYFAGCKLKRAKMFCVPASKESVSASNRKDSITPAPGFPESDGNDHICYKVKCPKDTRPADQTVADQLGERTLSKMKPDMVCMPAVKGCADSSRTNYVGGPRTQACRQLTTQEACESSWAAADGPFLRDIGLALLPTACRWDTEEGCISGPADLENSCITCAANLTQSLLCSEHDGDAESCNAAWHVGGFGATSCVYDDATDTCRGCGPSNELKGLCTNSCRAS